MVYIFSRTPEPPTNPKCPADDGEHEPVELVGSDWSSFQRQVNTNDGGVVKFTPCRKCGLMYWYVAEPAGTRESRFSL